VVEKSL